MLKAAAIGMAVGNEGGAWGDVSFVTVSLYSGGVEVARLDEYGTPRRPAYRCI